MKKSLFLFLIVFVQFQVMSCGSATSDNKSTSDMVSENDKIEVYYFHYTRRCATCNAVEDVTKETLQTNYAEKMGNDEITFLSVNLDEESNASLAEKYEVSGQALIFVHGDKKIDLTNDGFMNARSNPEKLKTQIEETVNSLLAD